ncbi:STAS domain-containing protein [Aquibacillus albus]|uniref:Anti-sigma factor antagonist n=1 Tax=Aquibacillus albus TaxID=1168171 RepID=A0ABS2N5B2_9BACI|nr:STAS domain-containing protein [Aquibacillus albus]MBM7573325.1 anti-sigma B factor antagonist/stage II sporulation protein AA (anti-sigma F factor antagonist) [Aquibacillus albus]
MFKYSTIEKEKDIEVHLEGDLDIDGTEVVKEELIPMLQEYEQIKINFEKVLFVDSSGIGLLLELVQSLQKKEKKVSIINVTENVANVFELLQLPEILGEEVFL